MSFTSFFSAVTSTVLETATKLKDVVVEATQDFEREQKTFVEQKASYEKENSRIGAEAVPPWRGLHDEEALKSQIIALSADKRNFLIAPPNDTEFGFDLSVYFPIAKEIMKEDPKLADMRFQLVPKHITEPLFWRNYFYRVSLIKQAAQLSRPIQPPSNSNGTQGAVEHIEPSQNLSEEEILSQKTSIPTESPRTPSKPVNQSRNSIDDIDFISDTYIVPKPQDSDTWMDQLKDELGAEYSETSKNPNDKLDDYDWEKELEKELGNYQTESNSKASANDVDIDL